MGPPPFGDGDESLDYARLARLRGFNGATAFRRWRWYRRVNSILGVIQLQWGHRLSAMELGLNILPLAATLALQWGHRLSAMEFVLADDAPVQDVHASMGPPPFGDGVDLGRNLYVVQLAASMGPPPFGDGVNLGAGCGSPRRSGFNGATAFRRWSSATSISTVAPSPCFNGATAFRRWSLARADGYEILVLELQWGHRLSAMEMALVAAIFGSPTNASMGPPPFGDGDLRVCCRWQPRPVASMGPPPFGDGDLPRTTGTVWQYWRFNGATAFRRWRSATGPRWWTRRCGFNGATAFRRWRSCPPITDSRRNSLLQWGHRLSAMEIANGWSPSVPARPGFNGATAFRRWRFGYWRPLFRGTMGLQWGHRLSAMEIKMDQVVLVAGVDASMGPPPFGDGDPTPTPTLPGTDECFNGATAFRRWR